AASESDTQYTLPLHRAALWGSARPPQAVELQLEFLLTMRTLRLNASVTVLVDAAVERLQVRQVGGVESFDDLGVYVLELAESGDHASEQNDEQITGIALHAGVFERADLVQRGCQPHSAFPVQIPFGIRVADRQRKSEFGFHEELLERRRTRSGRNALY